MSGDGPPKATPGVPHGGEPLDDIILGDDTAVLPPRPAPKPSIAPPLRSKLPEVPGATAPSAPPPPPPRRASVVDEGEVAGVPPPPKRPKLTLRIPDDEIARPGAGAALALGVDASHEPGWTPFQPAVDGVPPTDPAGESADERRDTDIPPPPSGDEIPVEMDLGGIHDISDEAATTPHLPRPYDSEEIKIEEGDRVSDVAEVEVAPEDLVSIESLPAGANPAAKPAPTASALMASAAAPAPAPSRPQVTTPSQPPPVAPAAPPATATPVSKTSPLISPPAAAPAPTALQKGSGPIVFVPPVGALAPPPMTDSAAARKKTRPWWEELFNDDYIRTMAKVTDAQIGAEVTFIEESLGCEAGAMILDLACGTGRHAVELATRGYQVVGFDLSLAMLARASDEAQDRKQKLNFVQGDMREMTFEETFDGVYSWNTSFGYFDEEKNSSVIARVHKALKKGGQFLLDVVNRDYIVRQAPSLAWFEGDGCICMDEMQIDFITSRMKVKRTLMMDDGRTKEIEYSIRTYALHELGKMLHDNGFRVAEVSGRTGTPGVFFGCESPRTLILAEKR
jgi:SAM-dependent methyltransferase